MKLLILAISFSVAYTATIQHTFPELRPFLPTVEQVDSMKISTNEWMKIIKDFSEPLRAKLYNGYRRGHIDMTGICGNAGPGQAKITGGQEVAPHKFPWMVTLLRKFNGKTYLCGGTLLNNQWVLTAAHCLHMAERLDVFLGAHNIREPFESSRLVMTPTELIIHPDFDSEILVNDIGLIKLPETVEFNDYMQPICLPSYSDASKDFANVKVNTAGWGKYSDLSVATSPVLLEINTETIPNFSCRTQLPITNKNICASGKGGKSACRGDSGGPMQIIMENGRYKQIGLTSFGLSVGCEKEMPTAFTRLTSYLEFIETETGLMIQE